MVDDGDVDGFEDNWMLPYTFEGVTLKGKVGFVPTTWEETCGTSSPGILVRVRISYVPAGLCPGPSEG